MSDFKCHHTASSTRGSEADAPSPVAPRDTPKTLSDGEMRSLERVSELQGDLARLRRANSELRNALHAGISDFGWTFDGQTTFTVHCESKADAERLHAALRALLAERSDATPSTSTSAQEKPE